MTNTTWKRGDKVTVNGRAAEVRNAGEGWVHVRWEDTRMNNSVRTDDGQNNVEAA